MQKSGAVSKVDNTPMSWCHFVLLNVMGHSSHIIAFHFMKLMGLSTSQTPWMVLKVGCSKKIILKSPRMAGHLLLLSWKVLIELRKQCKQFEVTETRPKTNEDRNSDAKRYFIMITIFLSFEKYSK